MKVSPNIVNNKCKYIFIHNSSFTVYVSWQKCLLSKMYGPTQYPFMQSLPENKDDSATLLAFRAYSPEMTKILFHRFLGAPVNKLSLANRAVCLFLWLHSVLQANPGTCCIFKVLLLHLHSADHPDYLAEMSSMQHCWGTVERLASDCESCQWQHNMGALQESRGLHQL